MTSRLTRRQLALASLAPAVLVAFVIVLLMPVRARLVLEGLWVILR